MRISRQTTFFLLFFVLVFLIGCTREITSSEAITIAQDFVNSNVKFYASNETAKNILLSRADIQIVDITQNANEWTVKMIVSSNISSAIKKKGLIVVVDSRTAKVNDKKFSYFPVS